MNLPNKLTLFRIIMTPVFMASLIADTCLSDTQTRIIAATLFALIAITDTLDGNIARKFSLITDFGKFMDPLADKFLVFGAMLAILVRFDYLRPVFVWAAAIVMFRELAVTSLRLVAAGKDGAVIAAGILGKIKTVSQMVCILTVMLEPVVLPFDIFVNTHLLSYITVAVMVIMTVWSGVDYLVKYKEYLK